MFCKQRNFCAAKGFLMVSVLLIAVAAGSFIGKYRSANNMMTYTGTMNRTPAERINDVNINDNSPVRVVNTTGNSSNITISFDNSASNPMVYLLQILFWLFLISPPVIVVLLLVIIKKMNDKSSIK